MNENLRPIDSEENPNLKTVDESSFINLPTPKKELPKEIGNVATNQKIIDKLPAWSIEPPLEIKRNQE